MTTLITGGTGFVGRALITKLSNVIVTSRNKSSAIKRIGLNEDQVVGWSPSEEKLDLESDRKIDSVVNLMGESIAEGRWNSAKKKRIRESRVEGTRKLVDAIIGLDQPPRVLVSASAVGIYGDPGESRVDESHSHGSGFLPEVCQQWEAEANRLADHGVRVVNLRIGLVVGGGGGMIEKLAPIFRWFVGGKLGTGKQFMPWIHVDDLVAMILWGIENEKISGPVNATAPNPVRNSEFTKALAKSVGRPAFLPAPKFGVRLILGEFADSLFFSQNVVPDVATSNGFEFKFTNVQSAVDDAVSRLGA